MNIHSMGCDTDLQDWAFWPDREEFSTEFGKLLSAAQEGGSTFAECFRTVRLIDLSDDDSWHSEWKKTADANRERGDSAFSNGNVLTARSNWLRAINYYLAAVLPYDRTDSRYHSTIGNMHDCAGKYLRHGRPVGEVVVIPWPGGYPLEGYFLPASAQSKPAPAIICIGEPGQRKEQYLSKLARYARDRGMSLLAIDLLGAGTGAGFEPFAGRPELEMTIGQIMDYLVERDDVDSSRIAILADGWGSSFVARGIAFDDRFAAAVCDGGIWDLNERELLREGIAGAGAKFPGPIVSRVARNIKCPVLISAGEHGWLKADRVAELYAGLKADGRDVTLRIFTAEETASAQGHADNATLANEFIFDWIASRLAPVAKRRSLSAE